MKADPFLAPNYGRALSKTDWSHVFEQLAMRVNGESMLEPPRIAIGTRFGGVIHALSEYAERITKGYRVPPMMDPDRLRAHAAGWGTRSRSDYPGPGAEQVEDYHAIEQAIRHAFDDMPEGLTWLNAADCMAVTVLRYGCNFEPKALAHEVATLWGWREIPEDEDNCRARLAYEISRATRHGHRRIWEKLLEAGMVPSPRGPLARMEDMEQLEGYDLQGLEAIGRHVGGVSRETVRKYINKHGLPVHYRFNRVYARRSEVEGWMRQIDQRPA